MIQNLGYTEGLAVGYVQGGLNPAAPVVVDPPENLTLPAISGTPQAGMTAITSRGTWTNSPTSYTYSWYLCDSGGGSCSVISGQTTNTYAIQVGDVGSTIRSHVVAHNAIGDSSPAISDAFGPIISPSLQSTYLRPGGVDTYFRPGGTDIYLRP